MIKKLIIICFVVIVGLFIVYFVIDNPNSKSEQAAGKVEDAPIHVAKTYKLIIPPCGKHSMMYSKFLPFSEYLSKSTGLKIELIITSDFKELSTKAKTGETELIYIDPGIYIDIADILNKGHLYVPLCEFIDEFRGKPLETGCIITRSDSNIKTLKDIKGKSVIFGPEKSATKWIAARKLFLDNGIDLEKDLAGYSFGGGCMDIVLDIFYKKADVGCIRTLMCPICEKSIYYKNSSIDINQLTHVAHTSPVSTWILTCTHEMDEKDMQKIAGALLRLSEIDLEGKEKLPEELRYGFIKVEDAGFDELRKCVREG